MMTLQIILTYLAVDAVASLLALYILHKRRDQFRALLSRYLNVERIAWSAAAETVAAHRETFHRDITDVETLDGLFEDYLDDSEGVDH